MLTATEDARVRKFTATMNAETAAAMRNLFMITKTGDHPQAEELIAAAHSNSMKVSRSSVDVLHQHGLVHRDGTISKPIRLAIRQAVKKHYLMATPPKNPALEPDTPYPAYFRRFLEIVLKMIRGFSARAYG